MYVLATYLTVSVITEGLCVFGNFIFNPYLGLKKVHCIFGITICYINIQYASSAYVLGMGRVEVAMQPGCV